MWAQAALLIGHPPQLEPFSTAEPSLSPPSQKCQQPFSHLAAAFSAPEPGGRGLDPLPVSPSLILDSRDCWRVEGWGPRSHKQSGEVRALRLLLRLDFIWRYKGNLPLPHRISVEGHHPGKREAEIPRLPEIAHPLGALSVLSTCLCPLWGEAVRAGYCFSITLAISLILGTKLVL